MTRRYLAVLALAMGCTHIQSRPGGEYEVRTFGSALVEIESADGTTITASGDGTNVFKILSDLWKAAGSVFGGGSSVVVNVPAPAPVQE